MESCAKYSANAVRFAVSVHTSSKSAKGGGVEITQTHSRRFLDMKDSGES
jgi:hypothetical protein